VGGADGRVLAALKISFGISGLAALVDVAFGLIVAWVLPDRAPGRQVVDAMVDLPFALPTAVAGIASTLYAPNGWIGALLAPLASASPSAHRHLHRPGLRRPARRGAHGAADRREIDHELEEASATLGPRRQTVWRVLLPPLVPACSPASPSPSPAPSANTAPSSSWLATCLTSPDRAA
jgi:sulfate transport system permease protein